MKREKFCVHEAQFTRLKRSRNFFSLFELLSGELQFSSIMIYSIDNLQSLLRLIFTASEDSSVINYFIYRAQVYYMIIKNFKISLKKKNQIRARFQ